MVMALSRESHSAIYHLALSWIGRILLLPVPEMRKPINFKPLRLDGMHGLYVVCILLACVMVPDCWEPVHSDVIPDADSSWSR